MTRAQEPGLAEDERTESDRARPGLLWRYLPILDWLPRYQPKWLAADFAAGLSVWALLVPQGLAYATVAGVPVQYGLYTAFAALIAYAVFGTSRQMIQGPSATVAAVSAAVIGPLAGAAAMGTSAAVPFAAALALVAGVIYVVLGLLRMGWVSNFLPPHVGPRRRGAGDAPGAPALVAEVAQGPVGRRRRRAEDPDGLAHQHRAYPDHHAVPGQPVRRPGVRRPRGGRDRRDDRADQLRRAAPVLPRQPVRLAVLHGACSGSCSWGSSRDPDRGRPVPAGLIARASKPGIRRLGLERESGSYQDITTHEGLEMIPGVLVVRVDGPLFFADAARFRDTLNDLIQDMAGPVRAVVLDADAISQTDTDGADIVSLVATELQTRGVTLALARVQPSVLELWTRAGAIDVLGPGRLFGTVRGAVNAVTATTAEATS